MSELLIAQGLQTIIRAMSEFADADVTINGWDILDQTVLSAPYVIISTADAVDSRRDVTTANTKWEISVTLFENFTDWQTTLNNFRARRQALIDEFNEVGTNRSAGGLAATAIDRIRSEGRIDPYYNPYLDEEMRMEAMPIFLYQRLLFSVEEY